MGFELVEGDVVIRDASGNAIGVVLDGAVYRFQTATKVESWLGSTAPTVGQKVKADSLPVTLASDQPAVPITSSYFPVIDFGHSKIHAGTHYFCEHVNSVTGDGTNLDLLMVTGSAQCHLVYTFVTNDEFTLAVYEGTTTSANGTARAVYNNNRNSANTPTAARYDGPTITSLGTMISASLLSSSHLVGGSANRDNEIILKPNTKYLFRVTKSNEATDQVGTSMSWYEV